MSNDLHNNSDWRLNCKNNVERWKVAREKKIFTDVEFKVGEGDSATVFAAHKNVLALTSPVFEAMFFGLMPEENLVINNTSPEAFNNLLSFLYGEQISFDSMTVAAMTYFLADQYIVEDLRLSSHTYLTETNLTESQFWDLYLNEEFLLIPGIEKTCQDYIENNACVLLKSPQLSNISPKKMEEIVTMEKLNITEFELLYALIEWGNKNVQSLSELRLKLSPLLCYIQFSNLTPDEFCSLRKHDLSFMGSDDAEMIMAHIHDKQAYRLPHWCTDSTSRRKRFNNKVFVPEKGIFENIQPLKLEPVLKLSSPAKALLNFKNPSESELFATQELESKFATPSEYKTVFKFATFSRSDPSFMCATISESELEFKAHTLSLELGKLIRSLAKEEKLNAE